MLGRSVRRRGNVESHDRWRVPVHGIHATRAGVHRGAAQREHGATATRARTLLASATVIFAHRPPPTSTALHPPPQPRVFQSHRSDLNRRPLDYESRALPLSYGGGRSHNLATQGRARYSFANRSSPNGNPSRAPRSVSMLSARRTSPGVP